MKKLLLSCVMLILLGNGCVKTALAPVSPVEVPESNFQIYHNETYGFEFIYPTELAFVTPIYSSLENKIVQLQTVQNKYPGTNFGDAAISVSATYAKSLAECLKFPLNDGGRFTETVTIHGTEYSVASSTGAGAGNFYESAAYRTLSGGQTCIELTRTIHTMNIGNYTPGTTTEVDKRPISDMLEAVVGSFKFVKR